MKNKPVIVGVGELLWDMLPSGKKAGGAPINFVYHASRLGAEGYAISAVGDDEPGREILSELDRNRIGYLIEKLPYPTGTVQIELTDGIPEYTIRDRVAWDFIPPTSLAIDMSEQADAICFGTLTQRHKTSRETIQAILSFASEKAYRFFDINIRQQYYSKELIEDSLKLCNSMKINIDELAIIRDLFAFEGTDEFICRNLLETYNLRLLALTAGGEYSTLYTSDAISTIPTPKVRVVDTVGAGDAFSGALITSLLLGASLKEAHAFAVEKAAYVCTKAGAWPAYE